jgi:rhodanese-related sulfurtransferase
LNNGEHSVDELAANSGMSVANTSRHLQILKQARLIVSERRGNNMFYAVSNRRVPAFFCQLKDVAYACLTELQQLLLEVVQSPSRMDPVGRDELLRMVGNCEATVVDVRPKREFDTGHMRGATSIPLDELRGRLDELPKDREIVAYCRGQYCLLADQAVDVLKESGRNARRTDEDAVRWVLEGLPVDPDAGADSIGRET